MFDDVDDITQFWETMYKETLHDFVNTRKSKVRRRSLPSVNRDIKKLMNQRYKGLQTWKKTRENSELRLAYTKLRNKINNGLQRPATGENNLKILLLLKNFGK